MTATKEQGANKPRWPYILLVIPPLLFILGIYLNYSEGQVLDRMLESSGTVKKSEVYSMGHGESTTYHMDLEYEYTVEGRTLIGRKIGLANIMYDTKQEALDVLAQYPVGQDINLFYDPQEPELAILTREEPGNGWMTITLAGILLFILWPVAFLFLWYSRKHRSS